MLPDDEHPPVRISVLGPLDVEVAGAAEEAGAASPTLRRQRVRTLLELLVLAGPLRRDRIGELMWPDLDPVAAGRNVRVTLSRLRAILEPGREPRRHATGPAHRQRGRVAPHRHPTSKSTSGSSATTSPPPTTPNGAAIARRRSPTSNGRVPAGGASRSSSSTHDELTGAVEEVRTLVSTTALRLGELLLVAGHFDEAATWADRVSRSSPYDERAHRLALAAHIHRRDRQAIAHAVATTVAMLDDFGVEPEPETQMLLRQAEDHIGHPPALAV